MEAANKATLAAVDAIFASPLYQQKYSNSLVKRSTNRVSNVGGISSNEFKELIKSTFSLEDADVKVYGPGEGPNKSRKFDAFEFPTEKGNVLLILAGKGAEQTTRRQELGLIQAIKEGGVTDIVFANGKKLNDIVEVDKVERVEGYAYEPYSDIKLKTKKGKTIKISAKGFSAPTFGGGGLAGMSEINIPAFNQVVEAAYEAAYEDYLAVIEANPSLKDQDLQGNKSFKDKYVKIPTEVLNPLLTGTEKIGGKVDYYYVGDMTVASEISDGVLKINGNLYTVDEFIDKMGTFYLRIGKRDGSLYFTKDINTKIKNIKPRKLFTIKPNGAGGTQSRAFITTAK